MKVIKCSDWPPGLCPVPLTLGTQPWYTQVYKMAWCIGFWYSGTFLNIFLALVNTGSHFPGHWEGNPKRMRTQSVPLSRDTVWKTSLMRPFWLLCFPGTAIIIIFFGGVFVIICSQGTFIIIIFYLHCVVISFITLATTELSPGTGKAKRIYYVSVWVKKSIKVKIKAIKLQRVDLRICQPSNNTRRRIIALKIHIQKALWQHQLVVQ